MFCLVFKLDGWKSYYHTPIIPELRRYKQRVVRVIIESIFEDSLVCMGPIFKIKNRKYPSMCLGKYLCGLLNLPHNGGVWKGYLGIILMNDSFFFLILLCLPSGGGVYL